MTNSCRLQAKAFAKTNAATSEYRWESTTKFLFEKFVSLFVDTLGVPLWTWRVAIVALLA